MPVPNNITDTSTTPAANSPAGSETPSLIDDYLRTHASFIATLRDEATKRSFSVAAAGGTADAITATYTPAVTALTNGMTLLVRAALANTTTTPTFSPNGLAAATIVRHNNQALAVGDIAGAGHWLELQYDTTLAKWVLQNPARTDLATTAYVDGRPRSFVNKFINGAFRTNQRAHASGVALSAGVPSTGVGYGHDGFRAGAGGLTYTFTQSKGPTQITITAGSGIMVAEDADIEGGAYVLSWEGTAQARIGINGAAPSGSYAASPILIPAANAGETISAEFNAGTLGKIQLETGDTPTAFEWPDAQAQLDRCRRYLPALGPSSVGGNGVLAVGQCISANTAVIPVWFAVKPRIAPTGLIASNVSSLFLSDASYTGATVSTLSLYGATSNENAGLQAVIFASALVAGHATIMLSGAADVRVLFTGAEL